MARYFARAVSRCSRNFSYFLHVLSLPKITNSSGRYSDNRLQTLPSNIKRAKRAPDRMHSLKSNRRHRSTFENKGVSIMTRN